MVAVADAVLMEFPIVGPQSGRLGTPSNLTMASLSFQGGHPPEEGSPNRQLRFQYDLSVDFFLKVLVSVFSYNTFTAPLYWFYWFHFRLMCILLLVVGANGVKVKH